MYIYIDKSLFIGVQPCLFRDPFAEWSRNMWSSCQSSPLRIHLPFHNFWSFCLGFVLVTQPWKPGHRSQIGSPELCASATRIGFT